MMGLIQEGERMNVFLMWVLGSIFAVTALKANAQAVHGVLRVVKGDVQIKSAKLGQTIKARVGEKVFPKDTVITAKDARAKIVMVDNNEINVSPESQIEIQNYEYDPAAGKKDVLLNVIYGKVRSKVEQKYDGKTSKFQIKTPSAVAGVRGTDFLTGHVGGITRIVTFHGQVQFGPPGVPPVMVMPGMTSSVSGGTLAPPTPVPATELKTLEGDTKADNSTSTNSGPNGNQGSGENSNNNAGNGSGDGGSTGGAPGGPGGPGGPGSAGDGASDSSSNGGNTAGSSPDSGGRAPANNSGGGTGPSTGGTSPGGGGPGPAAGSCTMCGGPPMATLPPVMPTLPPTFVPPPVFTPPPVCAACVDIPQSGSSKLIIHVNTN